MCILLFFKYRLLKYDLESKRLVEKELIMTQDSIFVRKILSSDWFICKFNIFVDREWLFSNPAFFRCFGARTKFNGLEFSDCPRYQHVALIDP